MSTPRYLLMVLVEGDALHGGAWAALELPGVGRSITRRQAEAVAAETSGTDRFLLPCGEQAEPYLHGAPLRMEAGENMWRYAGEPLRFDLRAVLRAAAGAPTTEPLPAPAAGRLPVRIATVREIAADWFGAADPHRLEAVFDELVFDLGGGRHEGDVPCYQVPVKALGLS